MHVASPGSEIDLQAYITQAELTKDPNKDFPTFLSVIYLDVYLYIFTVH